MRNRVLLDTCNLYGPALDAAVATTPVANILFGSDYPVRGSLERAVAYVTDSALSAADKHAILYDNAILCGFGGTLQEHEDVGAVAGTGARIDDRIRRRHERSASCAYALAESAVGVSDSAAMGTTARREGPVVTRRLCAPERDSRGRFLARESHEDVPSTVNAAT